MPEPYYEPDAAVPVAGAGAGADLAPDEGPPEKGPGGGLRGTGPAGPDLSAVSGGRARSLWSDAWHDLRRNPVFVVSGIVIVFLVVISVWPSLIASGNPLHCDLARAQQGSQPGHPFGFDGQGCDVYTRTVYGARTSVTVGVCATLGVALLGSVLGGLAGFFGGAWDALLSRITDVFFGIPVVLGGLVFLSVITSTTVWPVIGFIVLLGWPQIARIARGSVITAKHHDYVQAARALGASNARMLLRHVTPNAVAPVIVVATIALGTYISLEATLSYLGVGLKPPTVSWGIDLSAASPYVRNAPHMLLWPAGALAVTVLAFIMLGDAVRDALDPKLR
ncbi:peptide ABC transporter permease [Streptomyces agglomeratus]|uniref:Peptide ABC transporter permease n=1 Tax=Streptomyces agglomeratus TaxID=285458 RepID=A0A1E5P6N0_9ACTN|nr:ABC transporter permease [Streptomyces agglomeratus]OEJ25182.1 peptide ABC transporter permease [Streptomyces agglomeratus]OEJ40789.1 peptide ABC transporter permease [Streptomyces agglomeratus]OEJ44830.1 peptide ABC transporter permease [Streptomyces agglomeratus]OEJ53330.1 peptide ABC transporter permease [Streptomyces agglomeratus]OEJ60667.1 peptide ABC transporter permease [Streptomyces agglomeratus]